MVRFYLIVMVVVVLVVLVVVVLVVLVVRSSSRLLALHYQRGSVHC